MDSLAERVRRWRQDKPPDPPTGDGPPSPLSYLRLWLQVAGAVLSVVSLVGYGLVLLALRGPGLVERFVRIDPIPDGVLIVPDLFFLGGSVTQQNNPRSGRADATRTKRVLTGGVKFPAR